MWVGFPVEFLQFCCASLQNFKDGRYICRYTSYPPLLWGLSNQNRQWRNGTRSPQRFIHRRSNAKNILLSLDFLQKNMLLFFKLQGGCIVIDKNYPWFIFYLYEQQGVTGFYRYCYYNAVFCDMAVFCIFACVLNSSSSLVIYWQRSKYYRFSFAEIYCHNNHLATYIYH